MQRSLNVRSLLVCRSIQQNVSITLKRLWLTTKFVVTSHVGWVNPCQSRWTKQSGVAGNGDGTTVTNTAIASATTVEAKGDAIMEAIYSASAAIRANDYNDELYCVVRPAEYNALVLSKKLVNNDYTSGGNGGVDTGRIGMVGNIKVYESNNLPAWVETTNQLEALVFGREAVGIVSLIGLTTNQKEQIEDL